ncbi:peptidase S41 [Sphingomonas piscis]|uniref:Peptidase S41 n=1 Tax=Sphingomonas piscis TaxID=2714943 RepID=A0A6G7YMM3_9SPHN|nr:S41 family peptidase [Sphingomonas piscis]QIK77981.1 peptidase S41 [Sphingomonas piscis]
MKFSAMNRRKFLSATAALPAAALFPSEICALRPAQQTRVGKDLAIFRAAMAIHPGLYLHCSPREIAASQTRFEAAYSAAAEAEDIAAAYLALSRHLATIRCGHSYANFFNQNDADVKRLFERQTRLPFWFRWVGSRMIVTRDPSDMGLPRGTEVLELNGRLAAAVLELLLPYTRGDGANDSKRRSLLSVEGREDYETFDVFQGLLLPPAGGFHDLLVRTPDGRKVRCRCAPISLADRRAMMTRISPESGEPRWQWERRADGVVVLTMPGWAMWNSNWDWRTWLEKRLDSLSDAKGLIVDIRENEGGDDCGDPILARLINRPLSGWPFDLRLRFDQMPSLLRENSSTWDQTFYTLGNGAHPLGNGYFRPVAAETISVIEPSAKRITCPVVVLTSPVNSSATFAFINAARATKRVTLVGETTGGNLRGVNGGAFLFVKLPFSGIEFDLPLKGYVARHAEKDGGIVPDVHLPVTVATLRDGVDKTLSRAVQHALARGM